jgi:hypothetical protein
MSSFLIQSKRDPSLVIVMKDNVFKSEVGVSRDPTLANQWEFEVFPAPSPVKRGHYLQSTKATADDTVLVIDIAGGTLTSGTAVHVFKRQEEGFTEPVETQCWVFTESAPNSGFYFIGSFSNPDLVIAIRDGVDPQDNKFQPLDIHTQLMQEGEVAQLWTFVTPGQNSTPVTPPGLLPAVKPTNKP